MSGLAPPRLDDADAAALIALARAALAARGGGWRAEDAADPGLALIEAFAHVTAEELRRLNALPEAAHRAFLALLGLRLRPGVAAATRLRFTLAAPLGAETAIAPGLRISAPAAPDAVFTLLEPVTIPPGALSAEGAAAAVEPAEARLVAEAGGVRLRLPHRPLPGAPAAAAEIRLLVAPGPAGPPPGADLIEEGGRLFILYAETDGDGPPDGAAPRFTADRVSGFLTLPRAGPFAPAAGAEIRARYCWTAAETGALPPGALTEPLDPLPGIAVTNPDPVAAGAPPESAEAALARGAGTVFSGGVAVRPRDYEVLARALPGVGRAHAAAAAERWRFARPGLVEVRIAPFLPPGPLGAQTREALEAATAPGAALADLRDRVAAALAPARPAGVTVSVDWLKMKAVGVRARVHAAPGADREAIRREVERRLNVLLSPAPGGLWPDGWPQGRALRRSEAIETIAGTPGVRAVGAVELRPARPMRGAVIALAADAAQPGLWFAAIGGRLHQTCDDGAGWSVLLDAEPGREIVSVAAHPVESGVIAAARADGSILVSRDGGEQFAPFAHAPGPPSAMLWTEGGERARLIIGGDFDLCDTGGPDGAGPPPEARSLMAADGLAGPVHALAGAPDGRGGRLVAAARRGLGGVIFSNDSGWDGGWRPVGLEGHDVRALAFLDEEGAPRLVAGCARPVLGLHRAAFMAAVDPDRGGAGPWHAADAGWGAGGISALEAADGLLLAGAPADGLALGRVEAGALRWRTPGPESGLPLGPAGEARAPIRALAAAPGRTGAALVGGEDALLLTLDGATRFVDVADRPGAERVAVPADHVVCAATHEIEVCDDAG